MHTYSNTILAIAAATGLATVAMAGNDGCRYDGTAYSHGAAVCQSGTQFRCNDGDWTSLGTACPQAKDPKDCDYQGSSFSSGSSSCQSGTQYRCENGTWKGLALACPAEKIAAPRAAQTCMMEGGSTVGNASTICKAGVTYACDDGEWRNVGTACK